MIRCYYVILKNRILDKRYTLVHFHSNLLILARSELFKLLSAISTRKSSHFLIKWSASRQLILIADVD